MAPVKIPVAEASSNGEKVEDGMRPSLLSWDSPTASLVMELREPP